MTIRSKAYLYSIFENNDIPDQDDFRDLIDTLFEGQSASQIYNDSYFAGSNLNDAISTVNDNAARWCQEVLGTGNGVISAFSFTNTPKSSATTMLFENGVLAIGYVDWNFVNNQAIFQIPPPSGWNIASMYMY